MILVADGVSNMGINAISAVCWSCDGGCAEVADAVAEGRPYPLFDRCKSEAQQQNRIAEEHCV